MVFKIEKNGYFIVDSKSLRRFLRQLSGCFIFCVVVPEKKDIWKKKKKGPEPSYQRSFVLKFCRLFGHHSKAQIG